MFVFPVYPADMNAHLKAWCIWQLQYINDQQVHQDFVNALLASLPPDRMADAVAAARAFMASMADRAVPFGTGVNNTRTILRNGTHLLLIRFYDGTPATLLPKKAPASSSSSKEKGPALPSAIPASFPGLASTSAGTGVGGTETLTRGFAPMGNPALARVKIQEGMSRAEGRGGFQPSRLTPEAIRGAAHQGGATQESNKVSTTCSLPHLMGTYSTIVRVILFGFVAIELPGYAQATHMGVFLVPVGEVDNFSAAFVTSVAWYEREILFSGPTLIQHRLFTIANPFMHGAAYETRENMTNRLFLDPDTLAVPAVTPPLASTSGASSSGLMLPASDPPTGP